MTDAEESKIDGVKLIFDEYWKELRKHPWSLVGIFVLLPAWVFLTSFATAYIVAGVIDQLSTIDLVPLGELWRTFGISILLLIGAIVIGQVVLFNVLIYFLWRLELKVVYKLYVRCFNYLSHQSAEFHSDRFGGTLVSQTNKFVSSYVRAFDTLTFNILGLLFTFIFTVVILGMRVPYFAAGITVIALLFTIYSLVSYGKLRVLNERESEANNKLSGHIADTITNILGVKSFGAEGRELDSFGVLNKKATSASADIMREVIRRNSLFGVILSILIVFMFFSILYGQALVSLSIGTMILMLTYSLNLFSRLWQVADIARTYNRIYGDALPMAELLAQDSVVKDPEKPEEVQIEEGNISFEGVSFAYKAGDKKVFEDFSLHIASGNKVGLVGHSGSGKSTLTKLLLRFADVGAGAVRIDGQDVRSVRQADFRTYISYVPQEPLLFHRSIKENIAYGKSDATDEEIEKAAKRAQAFGFVEKLPDGFDTLVGERGVKLSGGQRQRIAIARAILKDAPILILDEATSSLDSESEGLIQKAFEELMRKRTSIVIAHRLSTIQRMDRIVVLEDGKIAQDGTHHDLLETGGIYAGMWRMQSGGFLEESEK